ncbi:MAG TPA: methylated-DNA--[protein]-cysteine S-methyltransferase [Stellaceae bacterium]
MADIMRLLIDWTNTPIGELAIITDQDGNLRAVDWTDHDESMRRLLRLHYGAGGFVLDPARDPGGMTQAIDSYFAGRLTAIDGLRVETAGTAFQRAVWRALREIPCGTTISYAALAQRIDRPAAVRAVGLANGANPVGIVVPCHRVVGSDGAMTGYGGGIERKRWLLAHERAAHPPCASADTSTDAGPVAGRHGRGAGPSDPPEVGR